MISGVADPLEALVLDAAPELAAPRLMTISGPEEPVEVVPVDGASVTGVAATGAWVEGTVPVLLAGGATRLMTISVTPGLEL